jgi:gluconate 2-dehydrogenase gamma chain
MSVVDRRGALRLLGRVGLGTASTPVWFESLAALAHDHAHAQQQAGPSAPVADWAPKALDAHQNELIVALSELIIPATDTPGAKAALVNRFVDAVVDDADEADRLSFLRGFDWIDARSRELFGDEFLKASPDQQAALLTVLSSRKNKTLLEDRFGVDFFEAVKELTIIGYYTSEIGLKQELHLDEQLFFKDSGGCTHPEHGGTPRPAAPAKTEP